MCEIGSPGRAQTQPLHFLSVRARAERLIRLLKKNQTRVSLQLAVCLYLYDTRASF